MALLVHKISKETLALTLTLALTPTLALTLALTLTTRINFGRLDPERGGRITLPNFVLAMNALDAAQGKPRHKDTKLLAMFKAGDLAATGEVSTSK